MDISLIICNYNYGRFLSRCIRSAIKQSLNKNSLEIIIVDDCSSDNSRAIIDGFAANNQNIKIIHNGTNMGLSKSCNKAVKTALGAYTYFLDADDFLNENALLIPYLYLVNNRDDIDACSCDYFEVDVNENVIRRRNGDAYPIRCGTMFKTDDLLEFGPYLDVPREDIEFRNRFMKSRKFIYNISVPLYRYTQNNDGMTKNRSAV